MSDDTGDEEMTHDDQHAPIGDVVVMWKGDAAEAHGAETQFAAIEWVAEYQDRIVLVPREGTSEQPPRITIYRDDICGFHELSQDL